jgi:hypothetical protein
MMASTTSPNIPPIIPPINLFETSSAELVWLEDAVVGKPPAVIYYFNIRGEGGVPTQLK